MSDVSALLALEQNLALMAGAGAGKTYNLVTLCLHLLGGARADATPLRTSQLCLLTFTDKAAAELKDRLRSRLDRLAREEAPEAELAPLRASYARLGRAMPPPAFWRKVRDDLGAALIGTFHSLCVQLLRRAPAGFGVDPSFQLLDEREAQRLVEDTAERLVLDALEAGQSAPVVELCRELSFTGRGRALGLVRYLCEVYAKLREEGVEPRAVRISDEAAARAELEERLATCRRLLSEALEADREKGRFAAALGRARNALEGLRFSNFLEPGRWRELQRALSSEPGLTRTRDARAELVQAVLGRPREPGLAEHYAACLVAPHERAFVELLVLLGAKHRDALSRRGVLDFSGLLVLTRNLLRDHLSVRREVQERLKALLVDEFQDTNRLQLELVTLLAERREGAPRPLPLGDGEVGAEPAVLSLPLEPGFLCAVGDRKQSIYEFRGADVSVFERLARKIEQEGGARGYLQQNWRSSPPMIAFFNEVFAQVMRPSGAAREYEVAYAPQGDDLHPVRPALRDPPCVERLVFAPEESAERCREQDADAVARWIRHALSPNGPRLVVDGAAARQPRGGEIAILFRRFTYVESYRQALTRLGIPHRVLRGRGFYGAQEVLDLAALLSLIADPTDAVAFAVVLRSPLVGLCDASLLKVAVAGGDRLSLSAAQRPDALGRFAFPPDEAERLSRLLRLYPRLRKERDRLGIRPLLQVALEETGYRVALAGTPYGEQGLANVDKLLELAARWDSDGIGECAAFARELAGLAAAEPAEAQADVLDAADPRAVQLLTIHQSKGLEWPVVVVPDLAAQRANENAHIRFDRSLGLSIRPWIPDGESGPSPRFLRVSQELSYRAQAEHRRLLYVALTRAKDHLVLSGQTRNPKGTWRALLDAAIDGSPTLKRTVRDVEVESLPSSAAVPAEEPAADAAARARVEGALARVRARPPAQPSGVVLPVTHLQDYFTCPRRYLYAHQVGLSEFPVVFELDEGDGLGAPDGERGRSAADRRLRGTIAHRLLEQVDLWKARGAPDVLREQLEELLWLEGLSPKDEDAQEIIRWVEGFVASDFAGRLVAAGPARVHRELPFMLRLAPPEPGLPAVHLKGQIDLLFEDEQGGATVVDYKASRRHPAGLDAYAFQLDCYALAARRMVQPNVPVKAGILFLREKAQELQLRQVPLDFAALERRLAQGGAELLRRAREHDWPGLPQAACTALRCGYQYRCHARTPAV